MNTATPVLSVLTAGISGSVRLREKLGSNEASWAIDRCMKRVNRAIEAFGGHITRIDGDEVIAAFETADASLQSAIEMQQRVEDLPPVSGLKIAIRIGISCGQSDSSSLATVSNGIVKEAAALAGLAKPGQILASKKISKLISAALMSRVSDYQATLVTESGTQESVLEVSVHEVAVRPGLLSQEADNQESEPSTPRQGCLRLLYYGETVLLNDSKTSIRMGRDSRCDISIHDRRASRLHAVIERRDDLIVLADKSANGTYVAIDGMIEQFLRHNECILHGKGTISFAASSADIDADIVKFELIKS